MYIDKSNWVIMKGVPEKGMKIWKLWHDFVELELALWAWHKKFPIEKDKNIEKKWNECELTCMWLRNVNEYECDMIWVKWLWMKKKKRNGMHKKKWKMQWNIGCAMKWDENGMHVIGNENEYEYDMIWVYVCLKMTRWKCQEMRNEMRNVIVKWQYDMSYVNVKLKRNEKWNGNVIV